MFQVITTLAPLFLTILLSWSLARNGFFSDAFLADLNKFIYWVALPIFIFNSLATTEKLPEEVLNVFGIFFLSSIILVFIAILTLKVFSIAKAQKGSYLQGAFRGNLAFIAIPIVEFALRFHPKETIQESLALAIFVFAPTMIFYNVLSVIVFMRRDEDNNRIKGALKSIASNPLILSSVLGVVFYSLPTELPSFFTDFLDYTGVLAGPGALICVGGGIAKYHWRGRLKESIISSILKVFILPILTWYISTFFSISPLALLVLMVLAASPSAVAGYVLAKSMKGDEVLASSNIVISTMLSIISLSLVLWYFAPKL